MFKNCLSSSFYLSKKSWIGFQKEKKEKGAETRQAYFSRAHALFLLALLVMACCSSNSIASNREGVPSTHDDKRFGKTCPPGVCTFSQGYLLGLRDKPFGVYFVDDKRGWIVGHHGLVLMTPDGGESLQKISISEDSFKDVFFIGNNGWIVGERGVIYHTSDGGERWIKQKSNVEQTLVNVFFLNPNKGFSVGTDGTVIKTDDAGSTWEPVGLDWLALIPDDLMEIGIYSINLYDIFFSSETSGWIVGDWGTVLYTSDGGKEWAVSHMGLLPTLFSVSFKNDRDGFAVGQNGYFLKTEDGGKNWEEVPVKTTYNLFSVHLHNNFGVIVGDKGLILKTLDGGKTWVEVPHNLDPPYPWFADAWILPSNSVKIIAVGERMIFMKGLGSEK